MGKGEEAATAGDGGLARESISPPHALSTQQQRQESGSEVVELGDSGVVEAEHQHAFSRGAILEVEIPGDFEGTAATPSSSSNESIEACLLYTSPSPRD